MKLNVTVLARTVEPSGKESGSDYNDSAMAKLLRSGIAPLPCDPPNGEKVVNGMVFNLSTTEIK